ncbi:hypothetical protein SprV_0301258500 [Sparganum proliferum]
MPLWGGKFATIVNGYTPSMTSPDATGGKFYEEMHDLLAFVRLANLPVADAAAVADENASTENRWCHRGLQSCRRPWLCSAAHVTNIRIGFGDSAVALSNLLAEKNRLLKAYVNHPTHNNQAAFYRSRRLSTQRLRKMQDAWTARKSEEIQRYADRDEWNNLVAAIKAFYGLTAKGAAPLLNVDGITLLTEKTQVLKRWARHFRGVLSRPSTISDVVIAFVDLTKAFDTVNN